MTRRCEFTGKGAMVGHLVSHANNKTKRRYLPNLQLASLMSDALGTTVQVRLSAAALRTIEKNGGLDAYLAKTSAAKLGEEAQQLKRRIARAAEKRAAA